MNNIIIRDIKEKDLPFLKELMVEAWGEGWNLNSFNQNSDAFQALLEAYLSMFLNNCTFGKVAVFENRVIGAILCSANKDKEKFRHLQKDRLPHTLALLSMSETERRDIIEHLSVSFQTIGQLLENKMDIYDGSLEYIVVSNQVQGQKIGKLLWQEACSYFNSKNSKSIYLIADSQCNTGFYDHNGFLKADTKKAVYNYSTCYKEFDVFLYEYNFN